MACLSTPRKTTCSAGTRSPAPCCAAAPATQPSPPLCIWLWHRPIFSSRGLTNVTSVDVDPSIRAVYAINGAAPTDPASAAFANYYGSYHGSYEPPFCHVQARALFDTLK